MAHHASSASSVVSYFAVSRSSHICWARSTNFGKQDPDSVLILAFSSAGDLGRIDLVHANVADRDVEGVRKGWRKFYWTPWKRYLAQT